jgi:hypothetical protein
MSDKPLVLEGTKVKQLPTATALQLDASAAAAASLNMPHGAAPTSPNNGDIWTTSAGLFVRVNGATVGPLVDTTSGGGGTAAWTLAGSWTWSANVASVPITGLAGYNELLIIARGVSASVSGVRVIQLSVNNGSSFFGTNGDYFSLNSTGQETIGTGFSFSTATTAPRTLFVHLLNTKGDIKAADALNSSGSFGFFTASSSDINAIQLINNNGGNLTAGSLLVFGR